MKFKKLISLSVCAMLALSSIASAATFTADEDGWVISSERYTSAMVADYDISADINVTKIDAEAAKAAGLSLGKGASAVNDDNSDFYKIELNAGVGDLLVAYVDGTDYGEVSQVRLYNVEIKLPGITAKKIYISSDKYMDVAAWSSSDAGTADLFAMTWNAGQLADMLPKETEAGSVIENAIMDKVTYVIATDPIDEDVVVTPAMKVTYSVKNAAEDTEVNATNATFKGSYVFEGEGKTEEDKPVVFTAPLVEKTANGYIWALNFTQSASKLASLKADFATADDSAERAFQNVAAFVATLGGADAGVTLNVGLKTTKTLTAATFTADDAVGTTEACVFEAPLSK